MISALNCIVGLLSIYPITHTLQCGNVPNWSKRKRRSLYRWDKAWMRMFVGLRIRWPFRQKIGPFAKSWMFMVACDTENRGLDQLTCTNISYTCNPHYIPHTTFNVSICICFIIFFISERGYDQLNKEYNELIEFSNMEKEIYSCRTPGQMKEVQYYNSLVFFTTLQ